MCIPKLSSGKIRCSGWRGQLAVVAQQHFLHPSKGKRQAEGQQGI